MAKQFTTEELGVLRRMMNEYAKGAPADFGVPRQKWLTSTELARLRRILDRGKVNPGDARAEGLRIANESIQFMASEAAQASGIEFGSQLASTVVDALAETFAPQPVKTSTLLLDAIRLIDNAMATISPGPESKRLPMIYGQDWKQLLAQLRERAAFFARAEQYRPPRTGEEVEALAGNPWWAHLLDGMKRR